MPVTKSNGTPKFQQSDFYKTPSQALLGGKERRVAVKTWTNLARSETRINLMRILVKEGRGVAELEHFNLGIASKFRSLKFQEQEESKVRVKILTPAMRVKIADEQCYQRELRAEKTRIRRQLESKTGKNSRTLRKVIAELRQEAKKVKQEYTQKFKAKNEHLKKKFNLENDKKSDQAEVPEDIQEFEDVIALDKKKYENLQPDSYEIKIIGDVKLTSEEEAVLKLHPKFCVLENLTRTGLEQEQEAALAKLRMEINKENEQKGMTEEEIQESQEDEARGRQVFDPSDKKYDARKRKVTDLRECARITLPKPLTAEQEAQLETSRNTQQEIFQEYRQEWSTKI